MSHRPRREGTVKDFKLLAQGKMSQPDMDDIGADEVQSVKSGKSGRSAKSTKSTKSKKTSKSKEVDYTQQEIQEIDQKLESLQKNIDSDPAYLTMVHESVSRKFGDKFVTEEPIPETMDEKTFEELKRVHSEEIKIMNERDAQLNRRQELIEMRDVLALKRAALEVKVEEQRIQERETAVHYAKKMMEVEKRKVLLELEEEKVRKERETYMKDAVVKTEGGPQGFIPDQEVEARTKHWVLHGTAGAVKDGMGDGKPATEVRRKVITDKKEGTSVVSETPASLTGSQVMIRDLRRQLVETQQQLATQKQQVQEEHLARIPGGMPRLKKMGLISKQAWDDLLPPRQGVPPNEAERKKLREEEGNGSAANAGKDDHGILLQQHNTCEGCGDKNKVKSGKFAKSNVNLKIQEQWPHLSVMRKYTKRTTFESMDFETYVAGESKIILDMKDRRAAHGRLELMCKLAHWLCRCRDWPTIKGLYEAVLDSIELGEEDWYSDFGHYEMMVPQLLNKELPHKQVHGRPDTHNRNDTYWCKAFQRGSCMERNLHFAQLKPDEPAVVVQHICAACFQKEGKRMEHAEIDCTHKKAEK